MIRPFRSRVGIFFAAVVASALVLVSAEGADLTFDLHIERGRLPAKMRLIRVKQGDNVRLRWRTDRALILHFHGYDIEQKVEPGAVTEMTFAARMTGRFPVHVHVPRRGKGGHSHEAPLVHIEVHPR